MSYHQQQQSHSANDNNEHVMCKNIAFQSTADHPQNCVHSYACTTFLLQRPWPSDLDAWTWPRYCQDVPEYQKQSFQVKAFKNKNTNRIHTQTHRQIICNALPRLTGSGKNIYVNDVEISLAVINYKIMYLYMQLCTLWVIKNWATFVFTETLANFGRF